MLVGDVGFLALKANLRPSANSGKRNASDSVSASEKGKLFFKKGSCEREILSFQHSPSFARDALLKQTGFCVFQLNIFIIKYSCGPHPATVVVSSV